MKILVTGDRNWSDLEMIERALRIVTGGKTGVILVHGAARGADTLAAQAAESLGIEPKPYPYIGSLGRAGGVVRNQQMLDENPDVDIVLAFHDDLFGSSKGTRDMVVRSLKAGKKVLLYSHDRCARCGSANNTILTSGMCQDCEDDLDVKSEPRNQESFGRVLTDDDFLRTMLEKERK